MSAPRKPVCDCWPKKGGLGPMVLERIREDARQIYFWCERCHQVWRWVITNQGLSGFLVKEQLRWPT